MAGEQGRDEGRRLELFRFVVSEAWPRLDDESLAELEERTRATIRFEGPDLVIESRLPQSAEAAKRVLEARARGFPYSTAMRLVHEDVLLESIHARSITGSKKKARRQISRVIGRKGEVKEAIEKYSGAAIIIRGSRINLLGTALQIRLATRAIEKIMKGYAQEDSMLRLKEYEKEHYFEIHPLWGME